MQSTVCLFFSFFLSFFFFFFFLGLVIPTRYKPNCWSFQLQNLCLHLHGTLTKLYELPESKLPFHFVAIVFGFNFPKTFKRPVIFNKVYYSIFWPRSHGSRSRLGYKKKLTGSTSNVCREKIHCCSGLRIVPVL